MVIDEVIRSLKSGKEATVYLVRSGTQLRCAKVYRDMGQRTFQKRAQYQEGRKVRGSREARAMGKATRFGRKEQEAAWKNAEVEALYQLIAADVRVPRPYGYFNDVLIMEFDGPLVRESVRTSPRTVSEFQILTVHVTAVGNLCPIIFGNDSQGVDVLRESGPPQSRRRNSTNDH